MPTPIAIDIVSDAVCPWCYVGKRRLEAALAAAGPEYEVMVGWRPFQLNPDMPPGGMDRQEYLAAKFGGEARARGIYDRIRAVGDEVGVPFAFERIGRTPNTIDAHRLIDRAGRLDRQDAVVEALFRAYFLDGRDIGDRETLAAIAAAAGLDGAAIRDYLASDDDRQRIAEEDAMARRMGIQGVPCFILNRKYAISGAQEPAVFLQVFQKLKDEAEAGDRPAA
jgi:predicted DsbA family dithiol-disulfide isomerase